MNKLPPAKSTQIYDWRYGLLVSVAVILGLLTLLFSPVYQPADFYDYADQRTFAGIPNFLNVLTNLGFALVALTGLWHLYTSHLTIIPTFGQAYQLFFIGLLLTSLGSAVYHYQPGPLTLVLDRIPIAISFISLYGIVVAEHLSLQLAKAMIWPLLGYGVLSVNYWYMTDIPAGQGNLAPYILVQLLPIIHIPMILWFYPSAEPATTRYYFMALGLYLLAKLAEVADREIYDLLGFSGHSLKHLLAAGAGYLVYVGWRIRARRTH
ncbi:hypothetical protein C9I92_16015 [Photobacterium ganghwense]|uniref:Alkaline phytoceramidase n=1 Tax=Photobacterium ganghwense TaxID=320778 RepID=A0A0J1H8S6_9GAMM|nr:hypothetical protein [Photobacterium ganghwense]KLV08123.1 hypothetical protein ABT57_14995 [Photobacterium ganghwense]PSU07243.1 hypothetical protein C9I92_16015 [Photobacterium ganghwense]QSV15996.1 hypothetical protein FH974_22425 [Photobacterium ganghwense]